ncbi:hypothetical protein AQUCO_00300523v1 [Aquilegia coerulea]|uniref:F-box domain-containing protein n=2 Tax=Aquilegia coerulea TaxID=218851 RepID=A0A2G5EZB0_AQUCA|nr:hypothetical protein AQUCO_00300523v1 [Aquilegia coerulea]PIA61061.1 hypothetical protein AQUCO_00300523v1 [Aquilegia coerulea]
MISEDWISGLPDEILHFTLSLMSLREAVRTSILSRRWRYCWKTSLKLSRSLNLDVFVMRESNYQTKMFYDYRYGPLMYNRNLLLEERRKFVQWVDQIMKVDYPVIDSFRLSFYLKKEFAHRIDQWISVAVAKRVQNLVIDLSGLHTFPFSPGDEELYLFPYWLFTKETGSLVKCLCLNSCTLGPLDFSCFSSLVDLQLENIVINQVDITKFLSSCPNLEKLVLVDCRKLLDLEISGRSLKLKYLTVIKCYCEREIKIDSRNLTRLEYCGKPVKFSFLDVPHLSNVIIHYLRNDLSAGLSYALGKLSSDLPKMESLFLTVGRFKGTTIPQQLPLFANLKKLVLKIVSREEYLWAFIPLVQAAPYLHTLELHLYHSASKCEVLQRPSDAPQFYLKEIVLSGFTATSHEIEFTKYLFRNCKVLEKIIIDCVQRFYDHKQGFFYIDFHSDYGYSKEKADRGVKEAAFEKKKIEEQAHEQLVNDLPFGVELLFV